MASTGGVQELTAGAGPPSITPGRGAWECCFGNKPGSGDVEERGFPLKNFENLASEKRRRGGLNSDWAEDLPKKLVTCVG